MATDLLKPITVQNAKPADKLQRLSDGNRLYLLIKPTDTKWRRFDDTIENKRKTLSISKTDFHHIEPLPTQALSEPY